MTAAIQYRPSRPSFRTAVEHWREELERRGVREPLCWLFRENLCLGAGPSRPAVTLSFQLVAPATGEADARRVYDLAAPSEPMLRFDLLALTPEAAFATMRRSPGFVEDVEQHRHWDLLLQYEPSYCAVARIDSPDEWRKLKRNEPASPELEDVLSAQALRLHFVN